MPHVPSVVTVTEDVATGGQIWTRLYARRRGFPQVIHSSKRFAGPTGLEEYVGCGVGMALTSMVEDGALLFRSARATSCTLGRRAAACRAWLSPGALTVTHAELGDGRFCFTLDIVHPRLGRLIRQTAAFRGGASMTTLLWTLIAIQIAMAPFDTIYHHELTERLAWRPVAAPRAAPACGAQPDLRGAVPACSASPSCTASARCW